jgi:hypothetical protein
MVFLVLARQTQMLAGVRVQSQEPHHGALAEKRHEKPRTLAGIAPQRVAPAYKIDTAGQFSKKLHRVTFYRLSR